MNSDTSAWKLNRDADDIAWLTLDKPESSTNILSRKVMQELGIVLDKLENDTPKALVIKSSKSSGFIAGADIKEFTSLKNATEAYSLVRSGQLVFDRLEALRCPVIAAIHGFVWS
jgi:3-hydroxyacyl-CoA dehydrogenase / enoyl-CoA hydratase / 3-hydroxybutyryl-CoA epimerase